MSASEDSTTNMSVHSVTPSTMPVDGISNAGYVNTLNEGEMAPPLASKEQESHGEEHVKSKIVGFCAFIVAKPKLSFGE